MILETQEQQVRYVTNYLENRFQVLIGECCCNYYVSWIALSSLWNYLDYFWRVDDSANT
jgi:hypothetical protein